MTELDMSPFLIPTKYDVQSNPYQSKRVVFVNKDDFWLLSSQDKEKAFGIIKSRIVINGTSLGVFWTGTEFETISIYKISRTTQGFKFDPGVSDSLSTAPHEISMRIYYPIDPRMEEIDVHGATIAYPNEDNTGWLFAHTDEGTHHDYELTLLAAIEGVIQPYLRGWMADMFASSTDDDSMTQEKFSLLSKFYGEVNGEARKIARSVYLGEREQKAHPKEGWLDRDITAAVAAVKAHWTEDHTADLKKIADRIRFVEYSLIMPSPETRWAREARLEAERKAAEAAAAAESESSSEE